MIVRELAGTCLELGKFDDGVELTERAVALHPDNHELLANLALAHLLTGRVKAGQIVKEIAPIVGGGGGGRPDFAEAGGKQPEKIDEMLKASETVIARLLGAGS